MTVGTSASRRSPLDGRQDRVPAEILKERLGVAPARPGPAPRRQLLDAPPVQLFHEALRLTPSSQRGKAREGLGSGNAEVGARVPLELPQPDQCRPVTPHVHLPGSQDAQGRRPRPGAVEQPAGRGAVKQLVAFQQLHGEAGHELVNAAPQRHMPAFELEDDVGRAVEQTLQDAERLLAMTPAQQRFGARERGARLQRGGWRYAGRRGPGRRRQAHLRRQEDQRAEARFDKRSTSG